MRLRIGVVLALVLIVWGAAGAVFEQHLPRAERGRRLAERTGCFSCHGPGGIRGTANPGRTDATVPTFEGDVMMYAKTPDEIYEWIDDGVTAKRAASRTWRSERARGALRMPAFKGRMSEREMRDLVAYVTAMSGMPEPDDSLGARGLERAEKLGCVGCHGAGGRLAQPNPGSLKGYVPSWDEADFPELVRDSLEFREWVERGVSRRLEQNRIARYFLDRAVLRMPAFRRHLEPGDVQALWAYVQWLRSPKPEPHQGEHHEGD
jgi:mono/diheme cytochrome c family protein